MGLISYGAFGKLRLCSFLRRGVVDLENWEFDGRRWIGEAYVFTEVLRLERDPTIVRAVSVDLIELPRAPRTALLEALGLPLRRGMQLDELTVLFGRPRRSCAFVDDRTTYEFRIGRRWRYRLHCVLLHDGGLIYVQLLTPRGAAPTRARPRAAPGRGR